MDFGLALFIVLLLIPPMFGLSTAIASLRIKRRRMEMLHEERMAALQKGVPLPELRSLDDPRRLGGGPRPRVTLLLGVVFLCGGAGSMIALLITPANRLSDYWALPLPLAFVGVGLLMYHFLSRERGD